MEIYLTPALVTLVAFIAHVRRNRLLDVVTLVGGCIAITLIAGLRWYADIDYPLYIEMYNDNPPLSQFSREAIGSLYGEPGYLFITAVFKSLDLGFVMLALGCAILSMALKSVALARFSRQASLALGMYLCLHFVTNEFIQMRWAVATGWLALGFFFQYQRKYLLVAFCFAMSVVFHYFSPAFWLIALVIPVLKGHRPYYILFGISLVLALTANPDLLAGVVPTDSDLYILSRFARYATSEWAAVGTFSILKLLMYPVIYAVCVRARPSAYWTTDPRNVFLFRVSMLTLSATLVCTFMPILHYRATILADFFSILLILNALNQAFEPRMRTLAYAGLTALFCTWYALDVRNYVNAGRLYDYQTWLSIR